MYIGIWCKVKQKLFFTSIFNKDMVAPRCNIRSSDAKVLRLEHLTYVQSS